MRARWKGVRCVSADHNARAHSDPWKQTDCWNVRYRMKVREIHREVKNSAGTPKRKHCKVKHSVPSKTFHLSPFIFNVPYISATPEHDIYPEVWETFIRDSVCICVCVCLGNRNGYRGLWIAIPSECVFMSVMLKICMCVSNERLRPKA